MKKIPDVKDIQIRLSNDYLKLEKNKIESILEIIQKRRLSPKSSYQSTMDHLLAHVI